MNCMLLGRVWLSARVIHAAGEPGAQPGDRLASRSHTGAFAQVEGSTSFPRSHSGVHPGRSDSRASAHDLPLCGLEGKKGG